ncbi:hypothetical protein [Actinomyces oricola]|uniref:hypothetical protein n=1 Tax=Actinomyces oricola TaxID=206043 RepID=UPI000FFE3D1A|nr:hypothetical protein [Actinomyces oricola]
MNDAPGPNAAGLFAAHVDVGSWARFTPTLATLLDHGHRPESPWPAPPEGSATGRGPGATGAPGNGPTVLLTAPAPVVAQNSPITPRGLGRLLHRRRAPSPEPPAIMLTIRRHDVEAVLPVLDPVGRVILDQEACGALAALGWTTEAGRMHRVFPDGQRAAQMVAQVLIEVLRVPHPADLSIAAPPRG